MKTDWHAVWEQKPDGGHRSQEEEFLRKEAREKLFHLGAGESILDFGCGSADLLVYFAKEYKTTIGADFSAGMLAKAEKRIEGFGCSNVMLIHADEKTVWDRIEIPLDRITCSGVVQYMNHDQLTHFIGNAASNLTARGKLVLFDIIDPYVYDLFRFGFFRSENNRYKDIKYILWFLRRLFFEKKKKERPCGSLGYGYSLPIIESLANKFSLSFEFISSMYYEYRFHAVFWRKDGFDE